MFSCPGDVTGFSMWVHSVQCRIWCIVKVKNKLNSRSTYILNVGERSEGLGLVP